MATNNTSSSNPRAEKMGDVLDALSSGIAKTVARQSTPVPQHLAPEVPAETTRELLTEKMLADHGIRDVKVISVAGQLTDHYNPVDKTVNLSEAVYNQRNAAAAAVAAHECGHAVQHAVGYQWLTMRSQLVPIVNVASTYMQWILLAGILMIRTFPQLLLIGIIIFAATTLFSDRKSVV